MSAEYINEKAAKKAAQAAAAEIKKLLDAYDAELDLNRYREGIVLITYYGDPGEDKFVEVSLDG